LIAHLGLTVDDVDDVYNELRERGANFPQPPFTIGSMKVCMGQDPEGNWLEFIERLG